MFALTFLNEQDLVKAQDYYKNLIGDWLANYTFSKDFSVEVSHIRFEDIDNAKGIFYVKESGEVIKLVSNCTELVWKKVVFGELMSLCPEGPKLTNVIVALEKSFFDEILSIDNTCVRNDELKPLSVNAYVSLKIEIEGIMLLNFYAPHSFIAKVKGRDLVGTSKANLLRVKEAIKPIKVPVSFKLNFGKIPFEEMLKMEVGSVITSALEMENTFSMSVNEMQIANVSMGKTNENIAFLVKGK